MNTNPEDPMKAIRWIGMTLIAAAALAFAAPFAFAQSVALKCLTTDTVVVATGGTAVICAPRPVPPVVVPAPIPPTIPPGSVTRPNEPAGMTTIVNESFAVLKPTTPSGWAYSGTHTLVVDSTAPMSATSIARMTYLTALNGGSSPGIVEHNLRTPARTLYVAAWMRLSPNFQGHPTATNKMIHFVVAGGPCSGTQAMPCPGNKAFLMARGTGSNPLATSIGLQGIAQFYSCGAGSGESGTSLNCRSNIATATIVRGSWHRYELVFTSNTAGARDGTMTVWLDGVLVLQYTGIAFTTQGGPWTAVQWSPTWGGGGSNPPWPFSMDLDHLYISSK